MFTNQPTWKVWKTIELGNGIKDASSCLKAIQNAGMKISCWASAILGRPAFRVTTEASEVNLVIVSVAEFDFQHRATLQEVYAAARERGLELCPAEVGPQLRLQYADQPLDEWLIIGMEPISTCYGSELLDVEHGRYGRWLSTYPKLHWRPNHRFVFILPSKKPSRCS